MIGWLRLGAAATYASVHRDTLRAWRDDGLRTYVINGVKLIKPSDIDEYIEAHSTVEGFDIGDALKGFVK